MKKQKTIYESALDQGISRRDFLKMCTALAATMGLDFSQTDNVVEAMERKNGCQYYGYNCRIAQDVQSHLSDLLILK